MCWQKNWIGSKKFQVFVKRTKSDRACRKIHLYALFFYVFSRKKSKSRKKGEKSEDKDKIALQIKQVKKGLNKRERSRAKRLQTIRKAFVHTFDYGFFYQCNQYPSDTGRCNRCWSWCLGRNQPDGRLWKRQPCDTFVSEKLAHKVEGQL